MESLLSGMYCTRAAKVNRQICCSGGRETDKMEKAAEDAKCYKDNRKWEMGSGRKGIQFRWTRESLDPGGGIWAEGSEVVVHRFSAPLHVESSWTKGPTCVPCIGSQISLPSATREVSNDALNLHTPTSYTSLFLEKTNLTLPQGLCASCSLARNILLLAYLHPPNSFLIASPLLFTCE